MKSLPMVRALAVLSTLVVTACAGNDGADGELAVDDLRSTKQLLCASSANQLVYYGNQSQLLLEANVSRDGTLAAASLSMPSANNLGVRGETWKAQTRYTPRNPTYNGMQKYSSADAWCGYSVIAPPNLNGKTGSFKVYVQQSCEGGFNSTAELSCKVETRRGTAPAGGTAQAALELRFTAARKASAIALGYYTATQFTGNAVVVASAETSIDIENILPDADGDDTPDSLCYTGDPTAAKKILWTMLGNTDGNGDHWLDEGATIKVGAAQALRVEFSVTGEGGSSPRELDVPVCAP
jgi:hypothetical protein